MNAFLSFIERSGNRLPDPVTIFMALGALTLLASAAAAWTGLSVVHPVTGKTVVAVNLLSRDGLRTVLTGIVPNFTGFAPLGTVLVAMIGIGVAERTGLFAALMKLTVTSVARRWITAAVVFAGVNSNIASDAGYVILTPLAAMLYASLGRHPVAGVAAVFAGVAGGFSANLMIGTIDPLLAGLTQEAARLLDPKYVVFATANYYFMATSVVLLTVVGALVSDRIVEPRLGAWDATGHTIESPHLLPEERRGLRAAGVALLVTMLVILSFVVLPGAPLRESAGGLKPFYDSLVGLLLIAFFVPGLAFGLATRGVRSDRDVARVMGQTMAGMGTYIVLAFFAGQFVAWFRQSELGLIIAINGANFLKHYKLTGIPLMVAFVILATTINLFMSSASAKWAFMGPVFVPMFMQLGLSPEVTQGLYRVGDSCTNCVTPLNPYFPIIIAVVQRYAPGTGLGTLIAAMLPYSVAFLISWTIMIIVWVSLGLDLGPGAPLQYSASGS
jgi:aminobenzoyl-glutamate transport protein